MQWLPAILILPYFFLLLKIYRGLIKIKPYNITSEPSTFVSVIVACRNEEQNLPSLLKSIEKQEYPRGLFEVIIVDDNSTDTTPDIASDFSGPVNIITLKNIGKGKKQSIRTGINASSGKLIITTDADCIMGERWIMTIAAFYEQHKPDMIICPVQLKPGSGFFRKFQELEFLGLQGITAGTVISEEATMCNGANLSFTKEAYIKHSDNLHDEIASGDDIFLLHSLKRENPAGILWLESPDSVVTSASSPTALSFLKQRRRWVSKANVYSDRFTLLLGIVTFVTIILMASLLIAGFFNAVFFAVYLSVFLIKSVPDWLILLNTSGRYNKKKLMNWFLPAQIIYPFYVICVVVYWKISSPSPKGT